MAAKPLKIMIGHHTSGLWVKQAVCHMYMGCFALVTNEEYIAERGKFMCPNLKPQNEAGFVSIGCFVVLFLLPLSRLFCWVQIRKSLKQVKFCHL